MEQRIDCLRLLFVLIVFANVTSFFTHCEARKPLRHRTSPQAKALKQHLVTYYSTSDPGSNSYLGSPYYLPPFDDVMGPSSSPQENPPYCIYPPLTPLPPSTIIPSPILPIQTPPPPPSTSASPTFPNLSPPPSISNSPPIFTPNPPEFPTPGPPGLEPSPPSYEPSPPSYEPSPPKYVPGPPEFAPGPPIFLPPIVYPPPTVPPMPRTGTGSGVWCVAKPTVPDPIIQEAMSYACDSGANCEEIQPNGACYQPDTLIAHASFAFNSYWQRTKVAGGNCDFGGTAILITKDPSYDGCHFNTN